MSNPVAVRTAPVEGSLTDNDPAANKLRWIDNVPFWGVHAAAVAGVVWIGLSWQGAVWAMSMYYLRMFGITGGYHRDLSHRAFKTSRVFQFVLALLGVISTQKGPLWWAAHHRRHHKYSDQPEDIHSPRLRGFWWSHFMWILVKRFKVTDTDRIKDFAKFPELRFMDRFEIWFTVAFATGLYFVGGLTALVWGYFVSTVLLWHGTFTINSLAHVWGKKRYETSDDSRNNPVLALLTMGEGWHNNHHHYQRAANNGFFWWKIDITFYIIKALSVVGIVWDVHTVPRHVRDDEASPKRAKLAAVQSEVAAVDDSPVVEAA